MTLKSLNPRWVWSFVSATTFLVRRPFLEDKSSLSVFWRQTRLDVCGLFEKTARLLHQGSGRVANGVFSDNVHCLKVEWSSLSVCQIYHCCFPCFLFSHSPDFRVVKFVSVCAMTKCHTPVIWVARPLRINSSVVTSGWRGLACLLYFGMKFDFSNCAWASGAVSSIASAGLQMRPWKKNFEASGAGHKAQFLNPNPRMGLMSSPKADLSTMGSWCAHNTVPNCLSIRTCNLRLSPRMKPRVAHRALTTRLAAFWPWIWVINPSKCSTHVWSISYVSYKEMTKAQSSLPSLQNLDEQMESGATRPSRSQDLPPKHQPLYPRVPPEQWSC